jgi:2-polyprenyl-3-methyl-5-hydroxy-6-metoxy-1,4-benzoquinol methylase
MKIYDATVMTTAVGCIKFVRPDSRVLEFGPGTGYATRFMRDALGCSVTAVECVPAAAEKAKLYAEKMIIANIDTDDWAQELQGCFDHIIFGDVLEHLRDPKLAIEKALKFLSPHGSVLVSVPNVGHNAILLDLLKGRFVYNDYGLLDNTHIYFFTRQSLFEMFNSLRLYAVASADTIVRPCLTEFNIHYVKHPLFSLCLVGRKDGHVYQFINEWKMLSPSVQTAQRGSKCFRLSPIRALYELFYDFVHLLFQQLSPSMQARLKARFLS